MQSNVTTLRRANGAAIAALAGIFAFATPILAQVQNQTAGTIPVIAPHPASAQQCAAFQVTAGTVQDLALPRQGAAQFLVQVWLGNQLHTLQLHQHEVRAPSYTLQVDDGTAITVAPTPACVTYQGDVAAVLGSAVAVTVAHGQMRGIVIDDRGLWGIQPLQDIDPNALPSQHVVYCAADNWNQPFHCGVQNAQQPGPTTPVLDGDTVSQAQIACEIDYPQYQRFNNVTNAQNDVTGVINAMDVIYRRDCNISYLVTTILVRTAGDPYSSTDPGTLLSQFGNWWNANQGSVQRDLAHLFTGRSINGNVIGIAYLGVICNVGSAYGMVETMYAGGGTNFTYRVGLSSHEIGHNWNAQHCDSATDCRIMCSGLGGCSRNVSSFSVGERNQIIGFRNSRSCLTTQFTAPGLIGMTPTTVPAFRPPQVTLNGINLLGSNQMQVGTLSGSFSLAVLSDTQARFVPPPPPALGTQQVRISNPGGSSNPLNLNYTATVPCELAAPAAAIGGNAVNFEFGGQPGHDWFLLVSVLPGVHAVQGQQVLSSFAVLGFGTLDAVGLGSLSVPVPPAVLNGVTIYEQLLEIDFATLSLVGASAVENTRIFL